MDFKKRIALDVRYPRLGTPDESLLEFLGAFDILHKRTIAVRGDVYLARTLCLRLYYPMRLILRYVLLGIRKD